MSIIKFEFPKEQSPKLWRGALSVYEEYSHIIVDLYPSSEELNDIPKCILCARYGTMLYAKLQAKVVIDNMHKGDFFAQHFYGTYYEVKVTVPTYIEAIGVFVITGDSYKLRINEAIDDLSSRLVCVKPANVNVALRKVSSQT